MGLHPFSMDQLKEEVTDVDIIINTIPSLVLDSSVIVSMTPKTLILDIASRPGGTDFDFAQKHGVKALLAPGLPGIVAPKQQDKSLQKCFPGFYVNLRRKKGMES